MKEKNQNLLPEYAFELFSDFDSHDPNSAIRIAKRVEEIREKHEPNIVWMFRKKERFAVPRIQNHPHYNEIIRSFNSSTKFVDLGCGCGWDLRRAVKDGLRIDNAKGIDINPLFRQINFELYRDEEIMGDVFGVGDALSTRFKSDYFDIIHSGSVIHGLEERIKAIKYIEEAYRVLKKPDGVFFGRTLGNDIEWEMKEPFQLYITTLDKLSEYFRKTGFKGIDIQVEDLEKKYNQPKKHPDQPSYMLHFYART